MGAAAQINDRLFREASNSAVVEGDIFHDISGRAFDGDFSIFFSKWTM